MRVNDGKIIDLRPRLRAQGDREPVPRLAHKLLLLLGGQEAQPAEQMAALALAARTLHLVIADMVGADEARKIVQRAYMLSRLYEPELER